jgi:hypothetical protein
MNLPDKKVAYGAYEMTTSKNKKITNNKKSTNDISLNFRYQNLVCNTCNTSESVDNG